MDVEEKVNEKMERKKRQEAELGEGEPSICLAFYIHNFI